MVERYIGFLGIAVILLAAYAWSDNRKKISWRLVGCGLLLAYATALFLLKIPGTSDAALVVGTVVNKLSDFAMQGAVFAFGDTITYGKFFRPGQEAIQGEFVFAIRIGVTIIYICGLCAVGYYCGILQRIVSAMGFVLRHTLGLSGAESLSCAASCWVGQVEAQLLIKPYMAKLTRSELFTSMTNSMATASGSALVMYMSIGLKPSYLITASLMGAILSIVLSKIVFPETNFEHIQSDVAVEVEPANGIFDAVEKGVMQGVRIAVGVVAMVMFAIAIMAMCNSILATFLDTLGIHSSIQEILGAPLSLVARLLGVPGDNCLLAGKLIATELLFNEVVSYTDLMSAIHAGLVSERTQLILTVALCGFAHLGSMGIQIGGLGEMAPERRAEIAQLAFKAMIVANMSTWLAAAICSTIV